MQKVLLIDDSRQVHELVKARLSGEPVAFHSAFDGDTGTAQAASVQPDLILLDMELPGSDGLEICRRLKADPATMAIPVVLLCGDATSNERKVTGLELGAADYVNKPFDAVELKARVRSSLRNKFLVDLLASKAMIDALTGLWNRASLENRLNAELALGKRHAWSCSCVMVDVDNFKSINQRCGHSAGDQILRTIAQTFLRECRTEDFICRYSGGTFAILTPGVAVEGATILAERLRSACAAMQLRMNGQEVSALCSFGVAGSNGDMGATALVEEAERCLRRAKHGGGNCVMAASSPAEAVAAKMN